MTVPSFVALLLVAGFLQLMTPAHAAAEVSQDASAQALPTLQLIQELERPATTTSVVWSSDGTKLATYTMSSKGGILTGGSISGRLLTIWKADGPILREIEPPEAFFYGDDPLAFVAGGKQIVATPWLKSNKLAFLVFDVETGALIREIDGPRPDQGRPDNAANALVAAPDESILAVVFGFGRRQAVGLYSTRDWTEVATLPETAADIPRRLAFSPDAKLLAISESVGGKVLIYDLVAKQVIQTLKPFAEPPLYPINTMAFSPDGSSIAIGSARATDAVMDERLRVFRINDGSPAESFPGALPPVFSLSWSPDGQFLVFITGFSHCNLHLWSALRPQAGAQTKDLTGHAKSAAFSPDGARLAVSHDNKVAIYSITR
jgi:WD40 repeat protein